MDLLIEGAQQIQVVRYTIGPSATAAHVEEPKKWKKKYADMISDPIPKVATITLITYEYLIALDSEVRCLWRCRLGFAGGLLFLCRYIPFFAFAALYVYVLTTEVDESVCINGFRASVYPVSVEFVLTILVLFTRAYAVWGGSRRVLLLLACVFVGATAFIFCGESHYAGAFSFVSLRIGGRGCLFQIAENSPWMSSVILIFCESLALGLLLAKYVRHARETKNILFHGPRKNILQIMAHDGIGYFAFSIAFTTTNIIVIGRITNDLRGLLFVIQGPIQVILCARLIFHIRAVNDFPEDEFELHVLQTTFVTCTVPAHRDSVQSEMPANELGTEMDT